jgi:hypothetical protein
MLTKYVNVYADQSAGPCYNDINTAYRFREEDNPNVKWIGTYSIEVPFDADNPGTQTNERVHTPGDLRFNPKKPLRLEECIIGTTYRHICKADEINHWDELRNTILTEYLTKKLQQIQDFPLDMQDNGTLHRQLFLKELIEELS